MKESRWAVRVCVPSGKENGSDVSMGRYVGRSRRGAGEKKPFGSIVAGLNSQTSNLSHQIESSRSALCELGGTEVLTIVDVNCPGKRATHSLQKRKILDRLIGKAGFQERNEGPSGSRSLSGDQSSFNVWGDQQPQCEELFPLYQQRCENFPNEGCKIESSEVAMNLKSLLGLNFKIKGIGNYPFYGNTIHCKSQETLVPSTARRDGTRQKPSVSLKDQLLKEYLNKRNLAEKKKRENPAEYYEILKKNAQPLKRFENEMRLQCAKFDYKQSLRQRLVKKEWKSQRNSNHDAGGTSRQNQSNQEEQTRRPPTGKGTPLKLIPSPQILMRNIQQRRKFQVK